MAQVEDTELRDLVIEALEKNGSLAKIRALLRANIFLAFEDEYEHVKQNINLDNVLKVPEGILALSIVHEFLESCNLKNTLFVYTSESRQGKEYNYEGKKVLADKFCLNKQENVNEPILVTMIKNLSKAIGNKKGFEHSINKTYDKKHDDYKDEQNSSYIVHDDSQSSTTSTSQSDNSMDEKNKLHLRLQLDNSDTDTSDSSRDKSSSEYIPQEHMNTDTDQITKANVPNAIDNNLKSESVPYFLKIAGNNSSDSTSYIDLKPFSSFDEKMLNTTGLPHINTIDKSPHVQPDQNDVQINVDSAKSATLSSVSSLSLKNESKTDSNKNAKDVSLKSGGGSGDYSNDFTISEVSKKDTDKVNSPNSMNDFKNDINKMSSSPVVSPHENSHSSISISDVADLISEKSSSLENHTNDDKSKSAVSSHFKKHSVKQSKLSDDSGDFTESPVPSLSNLSLDIHSD